MKRASGRWNPRRALVALGTFSTLGRRDGGRAVAADGDASERRFRDLAEALPQIVYVLDAQGSVRYVNRRWRDYTGAEASQFSEHGRFVEPGDRLRVAQAWERAKARGEPLDVELRLLGKDGRHRWFQARAEPARDERGAIVRWYGTLIDVDDARREATREALLSRVLTRLAAPGDPRDMAREIYETIAGEMQLDGYLDYDVEPDSATMRLASSTGLDDGARAIAARIPLGGLLCGQVATTREPRYVPDLAASTLPEAQLAREQGFRVYFCTPLIVGGTLRGTMSFASRRRDRFDDDEIAFLRMLASYLAIAKDRAATAQALRSSKERLRLALDTAKLGTWCYDVDDDELGGDARTAEILGLAVDAQRVSLEDALLPRIGTEDRAGLRAAIASAVDGSGDGRLKLRFCIEREADGELRHVEARGRAEFDGNGGERPIRIDGTMLDVSDRVAAEAEREALLESERHARREAERSARLKDDFLATLSHELRTPLNAVLGWTQVMRLRHGHDAAIDEGLAVVERNARAQAQIIDDLLDMSRIMSGKVRIDAKPVDLATVVDDAIDTVRPAAEAKKVRLAFDRPRIAAYVNGDASRLQQVMWNLLSNAVKFTPADGEVRVSLAREPDALVLAVADTGAGMDPRFVPQLFQRFQQADGSTARRFGGLGLGLAIVKQLVEIHGGTVEAHSPGPGLGSTFIVRIPAIDAPAMHSRSTADAEVAAARDRALAGARVLVVEDDADAREFIARLLREWGAMVRTAGSVSEALDEVKRDSPQLLVSDIGMPGEDGYALMRHVRGLRDRDARRVPAVALTAYARAEDRLKALQAGFDIHVPKPVEPAELLAVCSTLLSRAGERKE